MRWSEFYNGVEFLHDKEQPNVDIPNFLDRMAHGVPFVLHLFRIKDKEGEIWFQDVALNVLVKNVRLERNSAAGLSIECKTVDILPPGIRHGTYTLVFVDFDNEEYGGPLCIHLPPEMFEEGEVSVSELKRAGLLPEDEEERY